MSIQLADAKEILNAWLAAEKAVALGQEYRIGNRALTRTDAKVITEKISYWETKVKRLESGSGGMRVRRAVP